MTFMLPYPDPWKKKYWSDQKLKRTLMFYKQDKLLSVQKVHQNLGQAHHMFSRFQNLRIFHKFVFVLFYNLLWGISLGSVRSMGRDILLLNWTCISFTHFLYFCYNISICKKEKNKDETSKKIRETNGGQWALHQFHEFSLDVSSLIVTTLAFVKK